MKAKAYTVNTEKSAPASGYNEVQLCSPRPNKMFPQWMTDRTKFLRYVSAVPCTACGRRSKHHWTMTMAFRAGNIKYSQFTLKEFDVTCLPLQPVCRDHPLLPVMPKDTKPKRKAKK